MNQELHNTIGLGWMIHTGATAPYTDAVVEVDLLPTAIGFSHAAAVLGHNAANDEALYIKLQGNSPYTSYGFYHGLNNPSYNGWGGIRSLPAPIPGGRISAYVTDQGDTANLDIDVNFDGIVDYHFEEPGIIGSGLGALLGDGVGYGAYGNAVADNWSLNRCAPIPPKLVVHNLVAGQTSTWEVTRATPLRQVFFGSSLAGGGPVTMPAGPCGLITLELSLPFDVLPPVLSDANGEASISGLVPVGATGRSLWIQALDAASCRVSNGAAEVIG